MMATTHALAGMALASVTLVLAPEHAPVAVAAGALGGVFPDFDLYFGHRRTLHFPVYYPLVAVHALVLAWAVPAGLTVALAAFLAAAAAHSVMDVFGSGLELRPWEGNSERAVYDHFNRRWITPRRWVRYDGSAEDLLLAGALAVPVASVHTGLLGDGALGLLGISVVYVLVRKPMANAVETLVPRLPSRLVARLPERFTETR
jgi:hypothetical protein